MAVAMPVGDTLEPGAPSVLFETGIPVEATLSNPPPDYFYAVGAKGERFLLSREATNTTSPADAKPDTPPPVLHVIVNWSSGLPQH